jgi:energy-coupling factor transport system permease protein
MQDPRIRLFCAFLLSLAAFINIAGAAAVFVWWLVFTPRWKSIRHFRAVLATVLLFGIVSTVIWLAGSDGGSYFIRMIAILLVGTWVYTDTHSGDFLTTGTWFLGTRIGFELGMIAEMALEMAGGLFEDFHRIQIASSQKGTTWGIKSILPVGRILICDAFRRAEDTAEILAMRGYRIGGTICMYFSTPPVEIVAGTCAAAALVSAYLLR